MSEDNELINPNEWTQKELVKHLWRKTNEQGKVLSHVEASLRVLEEAERKRDILYKSQREKNRKILTWASVVSAAVGAFSTLMLDIFNNNQ